MEAGRTPAIKLSASRRFPPNFMIFADLEQWKSLKMHHQVIPKTSPAGPPWISEYNRQDLYYKFQIRRCRNDLHRSWSLDASAQGPHLRLRVPFDAMSEFQENPTLLHQTVFVNIQITKPRCKWYAIGGWFGSRVPNVLWGMIARWRGLVFKNIIALCVQLLVRDSPFGILLLRLDVVTKRRYKNVSGVSEVLWSRFSVGG